MQPKIKMAKVVGILFCGTCMSMGSTLKVMNACYVRQRGRRIYVASGQMWFHLSSPPPSVCTLEETTVPPSLLKQHTHPTPIITELQCVVTFSRRNREYSLCLCLCPSGKICEVSSPFLPFSKLQLVCIILGG